MDVADALHSPCHRHLAFSVFLILGEVFPFQAVSTTPAAGTWHR